MWNVPQQSAREEIDYESLVSGTLHRWAANTTLVIQIEIAGIKNNFMGRRSGGNTPFRAGVLFPDAGGRSGYSPTGHGHLRSLRDGADRAGICRPNSSAK